MKQGSHLTTIRSVIALMIMLLAFAIFLIFYNNSDTLLDSSNFYLFMILATAGMSLLLGLLYLVNNERPVLKVHEHKSPSKKKKK